MLVAREKRKTNIAEYILYMWQVEDLIRACSFNRAVIENQLVQRFNAEGDLRQEIADWYNNLALMMEKEHIQKKGHLQVVINLLNDLNEFHLKMLDDQKDQEFVRLYSMNRVAISEIVEKSGNTPVTEMEACLNALYGYMMLRLKKSEISPLIQQTIEGFSRMIGHLSARYIQFENDDFEF